MATTSALGIDGITAGNYKNYTDQLINFGKIWQASLESGKLPAGTAQVIITLIYRSDMMSNPPNYLWENIKNQ